MSKAFVREDDEGEAGEDDGGDEKRPRGSAYITPAGARKLQDELDRLWKVERPRVTREVEAAAAQGDRSENAEYIYGKKRLREIDRRLRFLRERLEAVTVVTHSPEQEERVFFGAWVTLVGDAGAKTTYRIVGTDEIDLGKGWISVDSPVAKSILGKRAGDDVVVTRPKGDAEFRIVAIEYDRNEG